MMKVAPVLMAFSTLACVASFQSTGLLYEVALSPVRFGSAGSADGAASNNRTDPVGSDRARSPVGTSRPCAREPLERYAR